MKIVRIIGGLGNQMFQYALALSLKDTFNSDEVKIDISCFKGYRLHNGFEVEKIFPNASMPKANFSEIASLSYPYPNNYIRRVLKHILPVRKCMCVENDRWDFDFSVLNDDINRFYDGYWQSEDYFKIAEDAVRTAFKFPTFDDSKNMELLESIKNQISTSIHVRRGDYVGHKLLGGICTDDYYKNAIIRINDAIKTDCWLIFSDDIHWAREHILPILTESKAIFVDWNIGKNSYKDMQLMSMCNHNIIANSSFSWWGAWLNNHKDKIVVAPKRWLNSYISRPVTPELWIQI